MSDRAAAPTNHREFAPRNWLLAALPNSDLLHLLPHLEPVLLARSSVLFNAGEPLTRVYFPESGVVSLGAVLNNRVTAGVTLVGREGLVDAATLLGGDISLGRYLVGVAGAALSLEVSRFRSLLRQSPKFREVCDAYAQAFFFQTLQAAACHKSHTVEQRCARWLLMCDDRTEGDTLGPTQEFFADMLGARRSAVTVVVRTLEKAGLICSQRGAIRVLNRCGLEAVACECYRTLRERYDRLLARAGA
jgi:CRP-like cAMP-binding protein